MEDNICLLCLMHIMNTNSDSDENNTLKKNTLKNNTFENNTFENSKKVQVFETPQVVDCFKVESDAALLPSLFNW